MKKHEQDLTWSDVYWAWKQKGFPPEEAAHRADLFIDKRDLERNAGFYKPGLIQSTSANLPTGKPR